MVVCVVAEHVLLIELLSQTLTLTLTLPREFANKQLMNPEKQKTTNPIRQLSINLQLYNDTCQNMPKVHLSD